MSIEQAQEFVKKTFTDDDFAIKVLQSADFNPKDKQNKDGKDEGMKKFTEAGKAMDYDFTEAEIEKASKEYMESLGTWKAIKKVMHFAKLNKKAQKQK